MAIKSLSGGILFEGAGRAVRGALEESAARGLCLEGANLRGGKLAQASCDGLRAAYSCFWGADLAGADMGEADLRFCDFRKANLAGICFAGSNLTGADFHGAYMADAIFEGAVLKDTRFSCPSLWSCDLDGVRDMRGLTYSHHGEVEIKLTRPPLVLHGAGKRMVAFEEYILWGAALYPYHDLPGGLMACLENIGRTPLWRAAAQARSRNANSPMLKRESRAFDIKSFLSLIGQKCPQNL